LLEEDRALSPGAGRADGERFVVVRRGRFQRRSPAGEVVAGEQPALRGREPVDRLRDEAAVEDVAGALDLVLAVGRTRLLEDAPERSRERRVAEERPGLGRRQVELGRRGPFAEQLGDELDRPRDARDDRIAVLGVPDRGVEHVGEPQRPELAQQQHPAVEGAGDARGEKAGAWHQVMSERAIALDRRGRRGDALGAEDERLASPRAPEDRRKVAAGAVQVRLDDLQGQARGHGRIERVPPTLEDRHPGG